MLQSYSPCRAIYKQRQREVYDVISHDCTDIR